MLCLPVTSAGIAIAYTAQPQGVREHATTGMCEKSQ